MPTKQLRTAVPIDLAGLHSWYHLRDELSERIDDLELQISRAEKVAHVSDERATSVARSLASLEATQNTSLADARLLITATTSLDQRFQHFEASLKEVAHNVANSSVVDVKALEKRIVAKSMERMRVESDSVSESVRELLSNFRTELVSSVRSLEARCAAAELSARDAVGRADALAIALKETSDRLSAIDKHVDVLASKVDMVGEASTFFRASLVEVQTALQASIRQLKVDTWEHVATERRACEKEVSDEFKLTMAETNNRINSKLQTVGDANTQLHHLIADRVSTRIDALDQRYDRLVEGFESFGERMGEMQGLIDVYQSDFTKHTARATSDLGKLSTAVHQVADKSTAIAERLSRLDSSVAAAEIRIDTCCSTVERNRESGLDALAQSMNDVQTGLSTRLDSELATLSQTVSDGMNAFAGDIAALQRDFDSKHKRLVETTRHALDQLADSGADIPSAVANLRHELAAARESVQLHDAAIERWRVDATALVEIKDWLHDLERRSASKSDLDQFASGLKSQIATIREGTHNAEVVMSQRLEAERSAREYEATSIRSIIQRMQSRVAAGASP